MLKNNLIDKVTEHIAGYPRKDIDAAVDITLESIITALINGQRVEIRGFGSFSIRKRNTRSTKNPKTGAIYLLPRPGLPITAVGLV